MKYSLKGHTASLSMSRKPFWSGTNPKTELKLINYNTMTIVIQCKQEFLDQSLIDFPFESKYERWKLFTVLNKYRYCTPLDMYITALVIYIWVCLAELFNHLCLEWV